MTHEPAEFDVIQYIRENFIYHKMEHSHGKIGGIRAVLSIKMDI